MAAIENRLKKLEQKTKKFLYPGGCTRAEIVADYPENRRKDTFYIRIVGVEPKFDENGNMIRPE